MSDYLPPDLLTEIFLRLPIKTLLRCTCVCKSWYSFIASPSFVTFHMNPSIFNNENRLLVSFCTENHRIDNGFNATHNIRSYMSTTKKENYYVHSDNETFNKCFKLDVPFTSINGSFRILGTSNGLVCLSDDQGLYMDTIILWNPSLRKYMTLPKSNIIQNVGWPFDYSIGFGFLPGTNDYKVVRVVYVELYNGNKRVPPKVELYESSTRLWRNVDVGNFSTVIKSRSPQAYLDSFIHWIGHRRNEVDGIPDICIVSYEMKTEKFDTIMVPSTLRREWVISVTTLGEKISVVHHVGNFCYVWVMKKYGITDSWTKLFTIDQGSDNVWMPICLRQNGEILSVKNSRNLIFSLGELTSYDPKSDRIKNLDICGKSHSFYVNTYMESLVLLKSLDEVLGRLKDHDAHKGRSIFSKRFWFSGLCLVLMIKLGWNQI